MVGYRKIPEVNEKTRAEVVDRAKELARMIIDSGAEVSEVKIDFSFERAVFQIAGFYRYADDTPAEE